MATYAVQRTKAPESTSTHARGRYRRRKRTQRSGRSATAKGLVSIARANRTTTQNDPLAATATVRSINPQYAGPVQPRKATKETNGMSATIDAKRTPFIEDW